MEINNKLFEIDSPNGRLIIEMINLPGQVLFRVSFSDDTPPLVICSATDINQARFWTSIPEGKQDTAEAIGPLIEKYLQAKMK